MGVRGLYFPSRRVSSGCPAIRSTISVWGSQTHPKIITDSFVESSMLQNESTRIFGVSANRIMSIIFSLLHRYNYSTLVSVNYTLSYNVVYNYGTLQTSTKFY